MMIIWQRSRQSVSYEIMLLSRRKGKRRCSYGSFYQMVQAGQALPSTAVGNQQGRQNKSPAWDDRGVGRGRYLLW